MVTKDNLPEGDGWVLFALTENGLERLALGWADVIRWMEEATWQLRYYRGDLDDDPSLQRDEPAD